MYSLKKVTAHYPSSSLAAALTLSRTCGTSLSIDMEREMSVTKEKLRPPPLQIDGEEDGR